MSLRIKTLTVEEMAAILLIKPNTIHNKKWQTRTGCPLKKIGRRLFAVETEFNDWVTDQHKLMI